MIISEIMPNVLILGGQENALSLVRSLSRCGIRVYLSGSERCAAHYSRYLAGSYPYAGKNHKDHWTNILLENPKENLENCIILTCADEAIEFVAQHDEDLRKAYTLEANPADVRVSLLRKDRSSSIAQSAGIAIPKYKTVEKTTDLDGVLGVWMLPVIVKPVFQHRVPSGFTSKLKLCQTYDELRHTCAEALQQGVPIVLCEDIPGPDTLLCSYYTYMDDTGEPLFHFTKKMIRRCPTRYGGGVYHISQWLPDVAEEGLKFFRQAGLRGLGNVEFKRDERDGKLKFIECNARFTAAQEQILRCGYDLGRLVYGQLAGRPINFSPHYREGIRLWYPRGDFRSYRQLSRMGELTLLGWLRSILHRHVFPFFSWRDPKPALIRAKLTILHSLRQRPPIRNR
jgi:D-aspartate ligase